MCGLRQTKGVDLTRIAPFISNEVYSSMMESVASLHPEFISLDDNILKLNPDAFIVSNTVIADIISLID